MHDVVEIVKKVGYVLGVGYWVLELERRLVYWPKGLGRPRGDESERGYQVAPIDKLIARIVPDDQGRFRAFLVAILEGRDDTSIDIAIQASWGAIVHVRMAGRQVGQGHDAKVIGLVEVIEPLHEAERLAKSLSFIVEALFISSDSGIVIFDDQLRVRRLNRNALDLFGVTDEEETSGDWAAVIEKRMPKGTRELLLEAIQNSSAVSGTLSLGGLGSPRLAWRANPWGDGIGDMSGLVMTFNAKHRAVGADDHPVASLAQAIETGLAIAAEASQPPELPPPPAAVPSPAEADARHKALEWVKHPIVLVSISTGEIAFANRAARDLFRLPAEKRCFVENLYDLSGFSCDVDPLAVSAAGGVALRLRLGARVGRMVDYDADLIFVEYHDASLHAHPHALSRAELADRAAHKGASRASPVVARPGAR